MRTETKLLLQLSKHDGFWRMDAESFTRFMQYVTNYFRECGHLSERVSHRVLYAEIAEEELTTVCFLYGTYSPDNETLMLAEVFPYNLNLPIEESFTLRLCVKTGDGHTYIIPTTMKVKSQF